MSFPRLTRIARGAVPEYPHLTREVTLLLTETGYAEIERLAEITGKEKSAIAIRCLHRGLPEIEREHLAPALEPRPFRP